MTAEVDKIAFTGSTEVGKAIRRQIAGTDKKLTLELGGKAANVIFDDAPLDQSVEGIVNGIYFNQGHVCCAGSRLLVQESVYEDVIRKLKRRMGTLRVGDPLDKNTDVGAINSRQQLEKIQELVRAGEEEGAEIYQPPCRLPERGYWFAPAVFTDVAQSYRIAQEEIFGPVLSVLTFRTPDEAVEKANNTPYGLSAGVWTDKGSRILWMAERLRAGVDLGEYVQPLRPGVAVRRLQGVRLWPGGRPARARAVPGVRMTPTWHSGVTPARVVRQYDRSGGGGSGHLEGVPNGHGQAARQEDVQALHGRRVSAVRVRALVRGRGAQRRPGVAQGPSRRRPSRTRRRSPAGPAARPTTVARSSTGPRR